MRDLPHPGFTHRVWPDGCVSLILVRAALPGGPRIVDVRVVGPRVEPVEVPVFAGTCYWGIRFRPEAGAAWLRMPATSLRNANLVIDLPGDGADALRDALVPFGAPDNDATTRAVGEVFDRWLASGPPTSVDLVVRDAAAAIVATNGLMPIAEIATLLGISARSLQRRFRTATGVTPKEFATLRRGRAALKRVAADDVAALGGWSGLADESGYADQSHLIREFGRLTQFTPTLLQQRLDVIDHGRLID